MGMHVTIVERQAARVHRLDELLAGAGHRRRPAIG